MVVVVMFMFVMIVIIIVIVVVTFFVELDSPSTRFGNLVEVELLRVENVLHVDLAVVRLDHLGGRLQSLHDGLHVFQVVLVERINLVQNNRVAEFNLLDEQVCDIFFFEIFVEELFATGKFVSEAEHVHNGDDVVQMAGERSAVLATELATCKANGLGYRNRFADTASFDEDVVELAHFQKFGNLFDQVGLERAADTTVRKRDDLARIFLRDVSALFN